MIGLRSRALRTVLGWQLLATAALAGGFALVAGQNGALSAALGGLVSFLAGLGFATVASVSKKDSVGLALLAALRAEAVKIFLIVMLLWVVLANYKTVVMVAFIGTFILTTILFSLALLVGESQAKN